MNYSNGDLYEGNWKRGIKEGQGRYLHKDGDEYVGNMRNNRKDG